MKLIPIIILLFSLMAFQAKGRQSFEKLSLIEAKTIYPNTIKLLNNINNNGHEFVDKIFEILKDECSLVDLNKIPKSNELHQICLFPELLLQLKHVLYTISVSGTLQTVSQQPNIMYLKSGLWQTERFLEPGEESGVELVQKALLLEIAIGKSLNSFSRYIQSNWGDYHWDIKTSILPLVKSYLSNSSLFHSVIEFYDSVNCPFRNLFCDSFKAGVARVVLDIENENIQLINSLIDGVKQLPTVKYNQEVSRAQQLFEFIQYIEHLKESKVTAFAIKKYINNDFKLKNLLLNKFSNKVIELSQHYHNFEDNSLNDFYVTVVRISEIAKINRIKKMLLVDVEWENEFSQVLIGSIEYAELQDNINRELIQFKKYLLKFIKDEVPQ